MTLSHAPKFKPLNNPFLVALFRLRALKHAIIELSFPAPPIPRKTRAEMMKNIDADYYGYRDEDDGILIPLELEVEKEGLHFACCSSLTWRGVRAN